MKLSDEQLANPDNHGSIARAHVWCGNHYEYPLIADMARELLAARKVVEAARVLADAIESSSDVKPGSKHAALIAAVRTLDEATK